MERQGGNDALAARLALWRVPGLGARRFHALLERFGDPREALRHGGALVPPPVAEAMRAPDWAGVERDLSWCSAGPRRAILASVDPLYPPLLKALVDPPPLLFVHGRCALLSEPQLAIVGSRSPSPAGSETAYAFARHLAAAGLAVTSGLALGIDAAAHQGALTGDGGTVAVLGTGADRIYPARHRELARAIVDSGGAVVSELPTGTPPSKDSFPRRNRIISGLSLGTLVVEAALHSGSLITARLAVEQGREVFAIPGSIHNPLARGCHRLIREGAKLVETAADILEELAPGLRSALSTPLFTVEDAPARPLPTGAAELLAALGHSPASVDQLVERSRLTPDSVSSILLLLELEGYVASTGGRYERTSKRVAG